MRKQNRLADETSPYLQQHGGNPVDWYPWGPEALAKSRKEQKPIFLSIGYAACHWCHVMERESFENEETAQLMNEHFVNIKVDREERQDLDHIYMSAVQVMTQHGGWPMSVFLTPELEPFYGGTYFPPEDRGGMPSFSRVLLGVANAWATKRQELIKSAKQLTSALTEMSQANLSNEAADSLSLDLVDNAVTAISGNFDPYHGGFGTQPKFFHTMDLRVCLRQWQRTGSKTAFGIVDVTLEHLARGGIYDHLGGGFHRYSTDQKWLVPHFEKMLYDNALLCEAYLEAFQATKNPEYRRIAHETLDYVLREMTSPEGGFFSTQDADTEGEEGKFYVWSHEEIQTHLEMELAARFCKTFGVTPRGNWEGKNILCRETLTSDPDLEMELATAKRKLLAVRSARPNPFRDEKIIVAWNGLMIHAMCLGFQVLGDERYLAAAKTAARFLLEKMGPGIDGAGEIFHVYKDGKARLTAYLDDYGAFVNALVSLYESDFDDRWLRCAEKLTERMVAEYFDSKEPCFYFTSKRHEKLITRPKELHDGATPSATSLAITALSRLGRITRRTEFISTAESALATCSKLMRLAPTASGQLLIALELLRNQPKEIFVAAGASEEENECALKQIRETFLPNKVVGRAGAEQPCVERQTTVYICENSTCRAPLVGIDAIRKGIS